MNDIMALRLVGILGLVALAIAALVVGGDLANMLMVTVAAGIGALVGYLFRNSVEKVKEEMEEH
jgi:citrate synthase